LSAETGTHAASAFALFALTSVLLFGLFTLRRMIQRNVITDDYKVKLDKIQLFLLGNDPSFKDLAHGPPTTRVKPFLNVLDKGGYQETVQLLNSLLSGLVSGLIYSYFYANANLVSILIALIAAFGSLLIQFFWTNICYLNEEQKNGRVRSRRNSKKSKIIRASREVVFKAISHSEELKEWFPYHAIFEPKVGKMVEFRIYKSEKDQTREVGAFAQGIVMEVIPNRKLSYKWEYKDEQEFLVTWEVEEIDANKTRVELVHSGFKGKEHKSFKEHDQGYFFDSLEKYFKTD
jgi:uncharacterized protein YndB with AHSA1/START domain